MNTTLQKTLFWNEVAEIKKRHSFFFPDDQLSHIKLQKKGDGFNLIISKKCSLPGIILDEIKFAFKLVQPLSK